MNWTTRQRSAIEHDGANLLVSAAAGSGKTAVLVERIRRLILEEGVDVRELLVVTFTNAAASEMKEKIVQSLSRALADPQADEERRQRLRRQLLFVGDANISTFHAFAYEIVRRYYHIIDKPPGLALCDETRQSLMKAEAMDELLAKNFERGEAPFIGFLNRYATVKSDAAVREMISSLYEFLQSLPDPDRWMDDQLSRLKADDLAADDPIIAELTRQVRRNLAWIVSYLQRAQDVLSEVVDEEGSPALERLASKNATDLATFQGLLEAEERFNAFELMSHIVEHRTFTGMHTTARERTYYTGQLRKRVTLLRDSAKKRVSDVQKLASADDAESVLQEYRLMQPQVAELFRLVSEYRSIYSAKKAKQHVLDFSDLERFALRILEHSDVRRAYQDQFRYIFIDEYQDSNEVQEALIQKICRDDNVFMVGDVKQSIYKFRLAEPELFIEKYQRFKTGASPKNCVVDLNSNFRSKGPVIRFVNEVFAHLMNPENTGLEYDEDAALVQGSPYAGPLDEPPVLHIVATEDDEEELDPVLADMKSTELEALQAARILKAHVGRPVYDDKLQKERPLAYRDMALLMRAVRGNGEVFYRALIEAGIPVILDRNEGYFDTVEIQVFLNCLRLVDNRKQDLPLLSVLRSPIGGFQLEELASIRLFASSLEPKAVPYHEAFDRFAQQGPEGELRQRCNVFLQRLRTWRKQSLYRPLGDFVQSLQVDTDFALYAQAMPSGAQRRANLQALVDRAEAFEQQGQGGLQEFIRHAEFLADRRSRIDVGQASLLGEDADAVRIMTVHKSKGLEFPFVLLAGLGKRMLHPGGASLLRMHKQLGVGLRLVDDERRLYANPTAYHMIQERLQEEERAESIRLLYVALTRAKDRLVLLASARNPADAVEKSQATVAGDARMAGSFLDLILPTLPPDIEVNLVEKSALALAKAGEEDVRDALLRQLEGGFEERESFDRLDASWMHDLRGGCIPSAGSYEPTKLTVSQLVLMEAEGAPAERSLVADPEAEGWEARVSDEPFAYRSPQFLAPVRTLTAAERGTAYHDVLERIPLSPRYEQTEEVEAFLQQLVQEGKMGDREAEAVNAESIARFFRSGIGRRILRSEEVYREEPFVLASDVDGKRRLVQGIIDCYFLEDDAWVLVDYKSHAIEKREWAEAKKRLQRTYLVQMDYYKEALERITGRPVKEAVLYLIAAEDYIAARYDT